jgi:hypothetical protein
MTRSIDEALGDVRRRARTIKLRRRLRNVGAAAVAVAVVSVAVAVASPSGRRTRVVAGTTDTSQARATTESPASTSTTAAPETTTTSAPVAVGRAQEGDLKVEVRATPSVGPAVSPVRFDIAATGTRTDLQYAVTMTYGDDTFDGYGVPSCSAPPVPLSGSTTTEPPPPPAASATVSRSHAYRGAGIFHVTVDVVSGYPCRATSWERRVTVKLDVRVTDGPKVSNGPQPPAKPDLIEQYPRDGGSFVTANVNDGDGYVRKLVYDWGDGTPTVDVGLVADRPCEDSPTRWPSSQAFTGIGHHYAKDGHYRVTVTVVSTGCDGKDEQRNSNAIDISWPSTAPAPPSPPS